jgi:putative endonuclease
MIYLYVIKSGVNGNLYVGICKDIHSRLNDHNRGKNRYTKGLRPWTVVFTEEFTDWKSARAKEKYYKSGVGKEKLKRILAP